MSDFPGPDRDGTGSSNDLDTTAKFDRETLVRGWREYAPRTPRCIPVLKLAAKTDMGQVREENEDKFDFYEPEDPSLLAARGCLYAVGDGIGGAQAGQIASEMMLKQLVARYYDHPSPEPEAALREAIIEANDRIFHLAQMIPERHGMGTTLTATVFLEDHVLVAQVGDSRAYLIRNGSIRQVTRDHSWVDEQVRAGYMSKEDAERSPFRNVITRSVGAAQTVEPDLYRENAEIGDTWILCSDGLSGYVSDAEFLSIAVANSPSEAARQFIELANGRGGRDNITVFILSIRDFIWSEGGDAAPSPGKSAIGAMLRPGVVGETETGTVAFAEVDRPRAGWLKRFGR